MDVTQNEWYCKGLRVLCARVSYLTNVCQSNTRETNKNADDPRVGLNKHFIPECWRIACRVYEQTRTNGRKLRLECVVRGLRTQRCVHHNTEGEETPPPEYASAISSRTVKWFCASTSARGSTFLQASVLSASAASTGIMRNHCPEEILSLPERGPFAEIQDAWMADTE